jgi:hypothetical protein
MHLVNFGLLGNIIEFLNSFRNVLIVMHSFDDFFLLFLSHCSSYSSFWLFNFLLFLLLLFIGLKLVLELFVIDFFLLLFLLFQEVFFHLFFQLRVDDYLTDSFFVTSHFIRLSHCVHPRIPISILTFKFSSGLFLGCKFLEEFSVLLV